MSSKHIKYAEKNKIDDQSVQGIPHLTKEESMTKATKSDNERQHANINLLTTTLMKFANGELQNHEFSSEPSKNVDRIHFFTPEVEEKWRNIIEEEKLKRQKISHSNVPRCSRNLLANNSSKSTLSLSGNNEVSDQSLAIKTARFPAEEKISDTETKEEASIIAMLGPIPPAGSNIFQGMSFVLEYVSVDSISPQQLKTMESNSEAEYLKEWTRRRFVRDRLVAQITLGGGTLYKRSELVPPNKYATTKLIMNIPNSNAESLFCLSVGIEAYSHQWIIRCCQENKIVNPAEECLPAGWSMTRQSYIEMYQRPSKKPFQSDLPFVIVIPMHHPQSKFVSYWERIIENSGGFVHVVENPEDEFMEGTVVLTYGCTPMWAIQKAKRYDIPLVTSQWAVECLIRGEICDYDAHPSFEHN